MPLKVEIDRKLGMIEKYEDNDHRSRFTILKQPLFFFFTRTTIIDNNSRTVIVAATKQEATPTPRP